MLASYDKIHMFDVDLPGGESYRESDNYQPGGDGRDRRPAVGPARPDDLLRRALPGICTARWPRPARRSSPCPSAFTRKTGEAHWHMLLRARAIETGCFVFAAAQGGLHENGRETYGHSLIVDPWGEILAEGGVEPGVFLAEIDPAKVETARKTIPSLQHGRRFGIADPKSGPEHLHLVRGSA